MRTFCEKGTCKIICEKSSIKVNVFLEYDATHLVVYARVCIYSGVLAFTPWLDNCFGLLWYIQVKSMYACQTVSNLRRDETAAGGYA